MPHAQARKRAWTCCSRPTQRGVDPLTVLAERIAPADPPVPAYAGELVDGVVGAPRADRRAAHDLPEGWTLDRMPAVDRAVLRLGVYELLFADDVPDAVAIDEAVELATQLSTDDSPAFVNGLLARLLALKPTLSLEP